MVNVPPAASKATSAQLTLALALTLTLTPTLTLNPNPNPHQAASSKNVVKKSSKKGSSKVEVWGADVVHPKKTQTNLDAFLRGEDKA